MRASVTFVPLARLYIKETMKEINFRNDILPLKDRLFRLALRIIPHRTEAEDIVQDTLIKVWSKRSQWPQLDNIEAFCYTVCRNLALDRAAKKEQQNIVLNENLSSALDPSTPYENLARQEGLALVEQLINGLPEIQRTLIQLRDVEGKSYKEIAEILHLSEEQVKVKLFRARQRVKQDYVKLENYGL